MEGEDAALEAPLLPQAAAPSAAAAAAPPSLRPPGGAGLRQTALLLVSVYVGLGLLSQPYALALGGWAALPLLCATVAVFCWAAHLLVEAIDELPADVPATFPALGRAALGAPGAALASALAGVELFGGLVCALAVAFVQAELLTGGRSALGLGARGLAAVAAAAALAPALALRDVSRLAPLAAAGSAAAVGVSVTVVLLAVGALGPAAVPPPVAHAAARWPGALQAVGIFAVAASGHSVLPAVRSAMRAPRKFPAAITAAFILMAAVYASVAAAGYYYFGDAVSAVLTADLAAAAPIAQRSGAGASLAAAVALTCAAKAPALTMAVAHTAVPRARGLPRLAVRLAVFAVAAILAAAARDFLGEVLGLVGGGCSVATSFTLPVVCNARLTWTWRSLPQRVGLVVAAVIGIALMALVTTLNVRQIFSRGAGAS
jgi:vesicular inhibitory amino acid transporter